jgi:hypothetical protein
VSTATRPAPLRGRRIVSETWVFGDERRTSPRRPPWRIDYNDNRPHRSLRMLTPAEFAKAWTTRESCSSHGEWTSYRVPVTRAPVRPNGHGSRTLPRRDA